MAPEKLAELWALDPKRAKRYFLFWVLLWNGFGLYSFSNGLMFFSFYLLCGNT
jgi:hypothetical protein